MSVALNFDLIKVIVKHGIDFGMDDTVDPSTNPQLLRAGVALVTTYIEQLSLVGIVHEPAPLFGAAGGMWIGYRLTDLGRALAKSEPDLRRHVSELTGGPRTEVSEAVALLQKECEAAQLNEMYREDFLKTLDEIRICFDEGCFIAAIGLCGKILEVCLKEVLLRHNVQSDPNMMVGPLIRIIRERAPNEFGSDACERRQHHQYKSNYSGTCEGTYSYSIARSGNNGNLRDQGCCSPEFNPPESV
jgi:hypothetical protein